MKVSARIVRAPWWGRWSMTVTIWRVWRPPPGGDPTFYTLPHGRNFGVYVSLLPVVRAKYPVHGRRWRWGWLWGRRGEPGGPQYLHLGPFGLQW